MSKYTPWFFSDTKPVRIGLYQREMRVDGIVYAWWNGKRWSVSANTERLALRNKRATSLVSNRRWRGIKEPA